MFENLHQLHEVDKQHDSQKQEDYLQDDAQSILKLHPERELGNIRLNAEKLTHRSSSS